MAMSAARVVALLLIAGLLTSPSDLASCGPFLLTAIFSFSRQPDKPDTSFAQGQLGVLLPSFYRSYLAIAYRHLTGIGVNASERAAFFPRRRTTVMAEPSVWVKSWGVSLPQSALDWLEARKKVPGAPAPARIDVYRRDRDPNNYSEYVNCGDDSFRTAILTLESRRSKYNAAEIEDWLRGQDQVFANCAGGPVIPQPAPDNSNALLKADRAYQIAAANFYAGSFDQAESQFRAIAEDQNSPWRSTSAYMLARCNIRRATVADQPDAMAQAQSQLEAVLQDASLKSVQPAAASLLNFVHARLEPESRLHELAQSILAKNASPTLAQDFNDYLFLFYKRDGSLTAPDDLTDWLATYREPMPASDYSLKRWRATQSLPWLIAALTQVQAGDASAELLQAADQIQPSSPAYATVAFHTIRLLEASNQDAEARRRLDAILASRNKYPQSAVNMFLAERMRASESWEAFLKYAPRVPVGSGYDYESESSSDLTSDPQLKAFAGGRPVFDADASTILNEQVPLARMKDAITSAALPATLRTSIAVAAWMRAVLIDDDASAAELAPQVKTLNLAAYIGARSKDAKKFEAVYVMLKNPGVRPFIETGFGRLTPDSKLDDLRDNWWCSFSAQGEDYQHDYYRSRSHFSTPLAMLYGNSKPDAAFLPGADRTQAAQEWSALQKVPAAPTFLSEQAVEYLKAHPDDPRAAETLALAVRSTRYGCGDRNTTQQSKAAFRMLHSRYPNSEWAKKTKYYY